MGAALERNRNRQAESEMDITNTDEELRILEETRRRLEEQEANQMEASARSLPPTIVIDESPDFDQFFKQAEDLPQVTAVTRSDSQRTTSSTKKKKPAGAKPKGKASEEDSRSVCSTGHRRADKPKVIREVREVSFSLRSISMPSRAQLGLVLPRFARKPTRTIDATDATDAPEAKAPRRTHSTSPMRRKINEQWESWNKSLKNLKRGAVGKESPVKGFVALLPGVQRNKKSEASAEQENMYEEVAAPPPHLSVFPSPPAGGVKEPENPAKPPKEMKKEPEKEVKKEVKKEAKMAMTKETK